jgi:hypothetical protein
MRGAWTAAVAIAPFPVSAVGRRSARQAAKTDILDQLYDVNMWSAGEYAPIAK